MRNRFSVYGKNMGIFLNIWMNMYMYQMQRLMN